MENELNESRIKRIITPATWKHLQEGYIFTRWLKCLPFTWDRAINGPVVARKLSFWRLHLVAAIVFYALLLTRMVQVTIIEPGGNMEKMYILFATPWFSIFILLQVHAALRPQRTVGWMQALFMLTRNCEGKAFHF